jgi:signal transduction histidine kinase/CheY-like chemotaxis protein
MQPNTDAENLTHISAQGQVQLMEMTYERLRFSVSALTLVALVLVYVYSLDHDARWLALWGLAYGAFALWMRWFYKSVYLADKQRLPADALFKKWLGILTLIALAHGLGLTAASAIMLQDTSYEVSMLWHVTLVAIMAGNATHQTPVLRVFMVFFAASWNLNLPLLYWTFPTTWQYLLPLSILYSFGIYRHAKTAHRFSVRQVQLQEHSEQLAQQFKQAKELAEQALRTKNQFITTASHDLRQPVHAMGMLVGAVSQQNDNPRLMPLIRDLQSSIRSVNLMFNSLLDLSKIEATEASAQIESVSLWALIQEVQAVFREDANSHGLSLRARLPTHACVVKTDPQLLRQALTNLVHNALRYTRKGGVLIGLRKRHGQWQLEVWDTGMGVADSEQERVFSPYYRDENAWSVDRSGYGLGLSVVARCAQLLGATYGLQSQLGRGSRFWLRLPESANQAQTQALQAFDVSAGIGPLRPLSGTCLVLEDDPLLIDAMGALLEQWGVQVRFATCAHEAFAHLDAGFIPQALLCDQRLRSGESGFEVMGAVLERCPQAGAAMMSGEFDSPALKQAEHEGYIVLYKPVEVAHLHAALERWLAPNR